MNGREEAPAARTAFPELDGATRIFYLEQLREESMPVFPAHRPRYSYLLHRHHEDEYEDTKPRTSASGAIICMEHTGTHIDALCHEADILTLYGGVPVKGVQTDKIFIRLGVEENLQLEELATAGQHRFFFFCVPLKFVGATGSPVRPLAIVSGDS